MTQSGFIAACLLAGFVIYLATQNKLSAYGKLLWGPATGGSAPDTSTPGGNAVGGANGVIGTLEKYGPAVATFVGG